MTNITFVNTNKVYCSGSVSLGNMHPIEYLRIHQSTNKVICPYCNTTFLINSNTSDKPKVKHA